MTMETITDEATAQETGRPSINVDIACVGFGPAMGGFLTTLTDAWNENPSDPAFESKTAPATPLQVICYERADDISAGVSGVVTRADAIRSSFPALKAEEIPMAADVRQERVLYLLDPLGASRRSWALKCADNVLRGLGWLLKIKDHAFRLPWTPAFLHKRGGLILSLGQFNQWVGSQLMSSGLVQIWPGTPVDGPIIVNRTVTGVRLADQGVDNTGAPADGFMPGTDVHARLTVVGDGPMGAVGQAIDERAKSPAEIARSEWALGMKMVIELPPDSSNPHVPSTIASSSNQPAEDQGSYVPLEPGTVWHTFGYPEPEIFGFLYVHPDRLVSVGIFVPSWMHDPTRTAYRYLQHYIQHPALWRYLKHGTLRSWGAKSLQESGKRGEPPLSGNGYARIGEGSGSTNTLTGSGVDEAWATGVLLGHSVVQLLREGKDFSHQNLVATYEKRRRVSRIEREAFDAQDARNGFQFGLLRGLFGMALAGLTRGTLSLGRHVPPVYEQMYPSSKNAQEPLKPEDAVGDGRPLHDALLTARGWPEIVLDGRLLVSQQDALLMGGKVQAMPGFADHVVFRDLRLCATCDEKTCIAMCSGQAITSGPNALPVFEREKCAHCGACLWNCTKSPDGVHGNIKFMAGAGGLHSAEN